MFNDKLKIYIILLLVILLIFMGFYAQSRNQKTKYDKKVIAELENEIETARNAYEKLEIDYKILDRKHEENKLEFEESNKILIKQKENILNKYKISENKYKEMLERARENPEICFEELWGNCEQQLSLCKGEKDFYIQEITQKDELFNEAIAHLKKCNISQVKAKKNIEYYQARQRGKLELTLSSSISIDLIKLDSNGFLIIDYHFNVLSFSLSWNWWHKKLK